MHILIVPSWYKDEISSTKGSFFEEQARMFLKKGYKVGIIYPNHKFRFLKLTRFGGKSGKHFFNDNGIPTYRIYTQSYVPFLSNPTKFDLWQINLFCYKAYKIYKKKFGKPDIIHAHSTISGGTFANFLSHKEDIPYFLTKHSTNWINRSSYKKYRAYSNILNNVVNNSKKTFVVSSHYKDELIQLYNFNPNKLEISPNVVNPLFFKNRSFISISKAVNFTVIGLLNKRKNHITLLKGIKILNSKGINFHLHIVGEGPMESNLKKFVYENELSRKVSFLGLLSRRGVSDHLKNSHFLISSSTYETFGVNIIEALAVGRPVVVYNSGGPKDIVRPEDGILFHENTPESFAKAIESMISNYSTYDQKKISDDCMSRFGENVLFKQLTDNYLNEL